MLLLQVCISVSVPESAALSQTDYPVQISQALNLDDLNNETLMNCESNNGPYLQLLVSCQQFCRYSAAGRPTLTHFLQVKPSSRTVMLRITPGWISGGETFLRPFLSATGSVHQLFKHSSRINFLNVWVAEMSRFCHSHPGPWYTVTINNNARGRRIAQWSVRCLFCAQHWCLWGVQLKMSCRLINDFSSTSRSSFRRGTFCFYPDAK